MAARVDATAKVRSPRSRASTTPDRRASAYVTLKQAILDRTLVPGQPLVESALAEMCSVSRTPIREALQRLEQDGLVERADRGLIVRECSPEEILDIYDARIALEGTAARLAADRRTNLDLMQIRRHVVEVESIAADDNDALDKNNRQFHTAIWAASHNPSLLDLLNRLDQHLARYPTTTLTFPGRWEQACAEHHQLFEAIEARNSKQAEEVAVRHFTEARDIRLLQWDQIV